MAQVTYSPGIEFVKGALAKAKKKEGHLCGDYLIGTHREAPTTNPNCTRLYVRKAASYVRETDPSQDELAARERFAAVSRAVAARKKSLATLATDQAAFLAQKDQPNGKKTFTSYLWSLELASYDQSHS